MRIEKIDHVSIRVKDARKAAEQFAAAFGLDFSEFPELRETGLLSFVETNGIEVVQPLDEDSPFAKLLKEKGEGVTLIALKVTDLDECVAHVKAHGIRQIGFENASRYRTAYFHPADCHGIMMELIEYKSKHPMLNGVGKKVK
ncbi:MAG: VOC family protein [Chloroflexi bacterium]|nr:VOC family protein [Chloroflexota bacterium]